MAQTGHSFSKDLSARLICGAGTIDLSAHGNNCDIDFNSDDLEATAYGDQSHTFLQGLTNFTFNYSGWWSGSHATDVSNSVAACVHSLVYNSSACTPFLQINPAGSTAGSLSYAACVNVQATPVGFPAENIATMSINFTARAGSLTACHLLRGVQRRERAAGRDDIHTTILG
jgi:hypothetical protein